jgi:starch synthase
MSPLLSPSYDNKIAHKYSARTLEHKVENKLKLQEEFGWPREPKVPALCIPGGMDDDLGGRLFKDVLEGILSTSSQILVRGVGSQEYGELFTTLEHKHRHRVRILKDEPVNLRKMYAAADMALFFATAGRKDEATLTALSYGVVPVAPQYPPLENYNPVQEAGNAFTCEDVSRWTWFQALARAIETFKFPFDWWTIQVAAMETAKKES